MSNDAIIGLFFGAWFLLLLWVDVIGSWVG